MIPSFSEYVQVWPTISEEFHVARSKHGDCIRIRVASTNAGWNYSVLVNQGQFTRQDGNYKSREEAWASLENALRGYFSADNDDE